MLQFLIKYKLYFLGILVGLIAGYVYYAQVGCLTGSCAITSNPWASTAYGGIFGYFIADFAGKRKKPVFENEELDTKSPTDVNT